MDLRPYIHVMEIKNADVVEEGGSILPSSFLVYGDDKDVDRFVSKIAINDHGCWEWLACLNNKGYGFFYFEGRPNFMAHRAAFKMANGFLSSSKELDHLCKNVRCVNPAHLQEVPHRINQYRGSSIVGKNIKKTHCKNGHEFTPENTYARNPNGYGGRECRACWKDRQNSDKVREYKKLWARKSRLQKKLQLPLS